MEEQKNIQSIASILANSYAKAKYYRLKAKADKAMRKVNRILDHEKVSLILEMYVGGARAAKIATKLGLTKEDVDAVILHKEMYGKPTPEFTPNIP